MILRSGRLIRTGYRLINAGNVFVGWVTAGCMGRETDDSLESGEGDRV